MHLMHVERARDLTDLPNITIVLGEALKCVGIASIADLAMLGAERAWQRLYASGAHPGAHVLFALEGAIAGIPWRDLPRSRHCELLHHVMQLPP